MTSSVTDVSELFDLLESSRPATVADIKNLIAENFNTTKESWLVGGLYDYYIQTDSMRCVDILTGISKEPHDRFLIDRINEGLKGPTRKQSLIFLGHLVRKQPSWLYKIVQFGLFREVIRILKTETDVVILVTGLLILITLLPIIPVYLAPYVTETFDVFSRLATWTHTNNHEVAQEQLLHLQVGLYSMFHRLYAMYPCNFLSYLRHNFSSVDKALVFHHTIKPMLETVKMHPLLVTANKDTELSAHRWKSKEHHDVIAECSKLSIDVLETGISEESGSGRPRLPPPISFPDGLAQIPTIVSATSAVAQVSEMANLLNYVGEIGTAPQTPITASLQPHNLTPPNADETAMEATPENTPLQTPVKDRERLVFKLPSASSAAVHLNFGGGNKSLQSNPPTVPTPTPVNSVPSSPLPQTEPSGPGRRESNAGGDLNLSSRRDSMLLQRLQKVLLEQQQQQQNESRGLHINIPPNESDCQEPPGGPLTPLLAPTTDVDDHPAPCLASSPCHGGLHMPETKSLIAFANRIKRLRFYSQCEDTKSKGRIKRSFSCPNIEEAAGEEVDQDSASAQAPRPPYEHLFEGIADVWGEEGESSGNSPHILLDECVKTAASLHGAGGAGAGGAGNHQSEARLRAQIELLHNQLLFERHRREAHTLRNRRLANKVRKAQTCEEQNATYRSQIHQLEKEIASLKKELVRQRQTSVAKETELQNAIKDFESKLKNSRGTIEALENKKMDLEEKLRRLREECIVIMKEADGKSARIFELENELKFCSEFVNKNAELQAGYQSAQKSIIMLGELCRRQEEMLNLMEPTRHTEDVEDIKMAYEEEIRSLKTALELKCSNFEACVGYIEDLKEAQTKKEKIIEALKKQIEEMGSNYHVKLQSLEDKHESLKGLNAKYELDILNLQHQVAGKSFSSASGGTDTNTLRNGVSPTDSDVTVDSAASAGGFGGLNSPERNEFIFGSPQFDNAASNQTVMRDLRPNID